MRVVRFYTYDSQPWRYGVVLWQKRCHHTGDTLIRIKSTGGEESSWNFEKIKIEEVLNISDEDLDILKTFIQ